MANASHYSLRAKLMTAMAFIVFLGFLLTVAVLSLQARQMQESSSMAYARELVQREAANAETALNDARDTAKVLAAGLSGLKANNKADRDTVNFLLRGVLQENNHLLAVWTGWEPNAFDGKDVEYIGKPGHDSTGRFVPYWNRGNGTVQVEPLVDYDKPGAGDFYLLPKQTGKEVLVEPYKYPVAGKDVLITSLVVPIMQDGRFLGVAGVDIALTSLQDTVSKIKVMETGHASLVSNTGIYVGDHDAENVGKPMPKDGLYVDALQAVKMGRAFEMDTEIEGLGPATVLFAPVHAGETTTPWSFVAEVQHEKVFEEVFQLTWTAVVLCLVSILVVSFVLSYALNRMVLRPIGGDPNDAAAMADRVAHGDLSQSISVEHGDTSSLMAQLKQMQDSLGSVVARVRESAENVALASGEISQGNQDLSGRTEAQASALEETAATMEQASNSVKQNAENSKQARQLAQQASSVAAQGGQVVSQVVDTMRGISDSSKKISDIISVIDAIAFQTNILALNAAVEAARAGEQGRGFAVVAGEVRTLAQRSASAAKEIKDLINESVERVDQGATLVDQAGSTMRAVVESIRRVSDIVDDISVASNEQAEGVIQINASIAQMDQVTQQNAALVEEMAAAAAALKTQADDMVQTVSVFRLQDQST